MNHAANTHPTTRRGFTIIELMLAMTFISILLLAIAMTIVQIANIYNKGMIVKELNITSRSINDELTAAIRSSGSFSLDTTAHRYVNNAWGGRLCVGQYSYIWNYGSALSAVDTNRNQYTSPNTGGNIVKDASGTIRYEIGLVKAPDSGGAYCTPDGSGRYPSISPTNAVELLKSGDHGLVLHSFGINTAATAKDTVSGQQLYTFSYTLGTGDLDAINAAKTACKGPGEVGADLNYCAVQQFGLVLRVVSGVN